MVDLILLLLLVPFLRGLRVFQENYTGSGALLRPRYDGESHLTGTSHFFHASWVFCLTLYISFRKVFSVGTFGRFSRGRRGQSASHQSKSVGPFSPLHSSPHTELPKFCLVAQGCRLAAFGCLSFWLVQTV